MSISNVDIYELLVDNAHIAMVAHDHLGIIKVWNKAAESIFLYTKEETIGRYLGDFISPEYIKSTYGKGEFRKWQSMMDGKITNIPVVDRNKNEFLVEYFSVISKKKDEIYSYYRKPKKFGVGGGDENAQISLAHVLEIGNYLVFSKDTNYRFTDVNYALEKALYKRKEDIIGKTNHDLFPAEVADLYHKRDFEAMMSNKPTTTEDVIRNPDGSETILTTTRFAVKDDKGNLMGLWGLAHDTTGSRYESEQKKQEEINRLLENEQMAIQSSKMKSEFLANMSHEIRTPMNGIVGLNDLLRDTELTPQQKEYVDGIASSSAALMSVINDILDISKVEAGKVELEIMDVDVKLLLQDLCTIFRPTANTKNVELVLINEIPDDKTCIKSDYGRLRQIINNLMSNAIKFTFTGKITVQAKYIPLDNVEDVASKKGKLLIEIIDTGIGIDADKLGTLFQPFTQAEMSTTRRFGGTGLGLSISKSLVHLMKGDIGVYSEKGKGSTFWFEIPYTQGEIKKKVDVTKNPSSLIGRSLNVLVAEDNPMNRKVAMRMLEALGQRVTASDNGLEALQLVQMNPKRFDVILMDCMMPVMDGYEATKNIRSLPKPISEIPIIAMTANALQGEKEKCLEVGMSDYMSKPIDRSILAQKLADWKDSYKISIAESETL